jgi:anti-anti-sigma factor
LVVSVSADDEASIDDPGDDAVTLMTFEPGRRHRVELVLSRQAAYVSLAGEIDTQAAAALTRLLNSLETLPVKVHFDLRQVTFLDSTGIEPLVVATRLRRQRGLPPLMIDACSGPAKRLLAAAGLGAGPLLDVSGWDHLDPAAAGRQAQAGDPLGAGA